MIALMNFTVLVGLSRKVFVAACVVSLLLGGCSAQKSVQRTTVPSRPAAAHASLNQLHVVGQPATPPPPAPTWIDSVLRRMSLEEKAAQMVCVFTFSHYFASDDDRWKELVRLVTKRKIGGFVFSEGAVYAYPVYANKLQKLSDTPLLISTDFERGPGMRVEESTMLPRAMAVAATRDIRLSYQAGYITAIEGRALGVHQNYAPVADVNENPKNPVINTRAFGSDPVLVADMTAAFVRGTQDGGMIATVKHFPGHGNTEIDSHIGSPSVDAPRERWEANDLMPFRSALHAGALSVMTGHIITPSYDRSNTPASISSALTTDLLRTSLGFSGLVVTDAMNMRGISRNYSNDEAAVLAVRAGNDVVLMPPDADGAIDAIVRAVKRGEITEARIDESVRRILKAKQWAGLDTNRFVDIANVSDAVATAPHLALAKEIAQKSITVLGNKERLLPLTLSRTKKIVDIAFTEKENQSEGRAFHRAVQRSHRASEFLKIDLRSNAMEYATVLEKAKTADVLLLHFYVEAHSRLTYLPVQFAECVKKLLAMGIPTVAVSFGNPYIVLEFPSVENYVCAYGSSDASIDAAAEIIFGDEPAEGKLPITIPGLYKFGEGSTYGRHDELRAGVPEDAGFDPIALAKADSVVLEGIANKAYPGAVLLVAKDGIIVKNTAYGHYTYDPASTADSPETMFDMASVSKVISTTSAIMRLYDEHRIDLDATVASYLPPFAQRGKENITIRNLLLHNSGLPGWRKFYTFCNDPKCVMDSLFATPLDYPTGTQSIYSDLGFITLGKVVEKISHATLDHYMDSVFFKPLGMSMTMYNPPAQLKERIAPTEIDSFWHKTYMPVQGRVHDENAATLGGVSGHAGLFSTGADLAALLQMELNGGIYRGTRFIQESTIKMFTTRQSDFSTRCLGWDSKNLTGSWAGKLVSNRAFLHTGFTGTSVVVDPTRKLIVIFLTNRVYPTRDNNRLSKVRPAVHDAIIEAIEDTKEE
jgi:beta-N-acetylhexosaminidase